MKFFNKGTFYDTREKRNYSCLKKYGIIFIVAIIFIGVYGVIKSMTSPNHLTSGPAVPQTMYIESSGGTYYGAVEKALYKGKGIFKFLKEGKYVGEFSQSKRNGSGTFIWNNGDALTGTWKDDQIVEGTYITLQGVTIEGSFTNNKLQNGIISLKNQAAQNLGFLKFTAKVENGNIRSLEFSMINGASYSGGVNGNATITYPSGNTYKGSVVNYKRDGKGTFNWNIEGNVIASYSGNWKEDNMNGEGTYTYTQEKYPYIKGNFTDGRLDGKAQYYKSQNEKFTTEWDNGTCEKVSKG